MKTLGIMTQNGIYTNLGLLLSNQCVHTIKVDDRKEANRAGRQRKKSPLPYLGIIYFPTAPLIYLFLKSSLKNLSTHCVSKIYIDGILFYQSICLNLYFPFP